MSRLTDLFGIDLYCDSKEISVSSTSNLENVQSFYFSGELGTVNENCFIYKTTNLINSKIYIGKRKIGNNKGDQEYLGSGKILKYSINKHGKENFKREILEYCNEETVNEKEKYWIKTFNSTDHKIGYNIAIGGGGGDILQAKGKTYEEMYGEEKGKKLKKLKAGSNNPMYGIGGMKGKKHKKETIVKMKIARQRIRDKDVTKEIIDTIIKMRLEKFTFREISLKINMYEEKIRIIFLNQYIRKLSQEDIEKLPYYIYNPKRVNAGKESKKKQMEMRKLK